MRKTTVFAGFCLAAFGLTGLAGLLGARAIETANRSLAARTLAAAGFDWAHVEADGLRVTLSGEAPDADLRREAADMVRGVIRAAGFGQPSLIDETRAPSRPARKLRPPEIAIMRGREDIAIAGLSPGEEMRAALREAMRRAAPALTLDDFSSIADVEPGGASWSSAFGPAAEIIAALVHGRIVLTPGVVSLSGVPGGREDLARIDAAIEALEGLGWSVRSDLASLETASAVFILEAEKGPAASGMTTCVAGDEAEAARLVRAAKALGAGEPSCDLGEDAPEDWARAGEAALRALATLPAGALGVVDKRVRLTAAAPTRKREFESAAAALGDALPPGYDLTALATGALDDEPAPAEAEADAPARATPPAPLVIARSGDTLTLAGDAPDPLICESVVAYARVTMPGVEVKSAFTFGPAVEDGWRAGAMAIISALGALESGTGRLDAETATVEGRIADPLAIGALHRDFAEALEGLRRPVTRIEVSPAALAAEQLLPPARCAAELTEAAAADPIRFAPGSAEIDAASAPVVARLVSTLNRCAGGRIEIAGHTDSQGSEGGNLRLSQARAQAVLAALLNAGARLAQLSAEGYGESAPIADNDTEAGRARNRRIEFRHLPEGEAP